MRIFRRISSTISATVDQAITRVENHDAIIQAAIKRTQANAATARVRMARVQKDGEVLRTKRNTLQQSIDNWARRAKEVAEDDKTTALECVRRRRLALEQLAQVTASLGQHEELEQNITRTLHELHERIAHMNQQRNQLRSRESVAEAVRVINELDGTGGYDIDDTFERWEVMITENEFCGTAPSQVDDLEARFIHEEDRTALEADLALLLSDGENSNDHIQ